MRQPMKHTGYFIIPLAWIAVIFIVCLTPSDDLPMTSLANIPHFDKIVHFGLYFILAVLLYRPLRTTKAPAGLSVLLVSLFIGGTIELLQYHVIPDRSASLMDVAFDIAGAATGLLVYQLTARGKARGKPV